MRAGAPFVLISPQGLESVAVLLKDTASCRAVTHVETNSRLAPELPQDKVEDARQSHQISHFLAIVGENKASKAIFSADIPINS